MSTVKINQGDIILINSYRIVIASNSTIYFLKDLHHKNVELEEYIECTRPIVKYLHEEGFIVKNSIKVAILSNY